MDITFVVVTYNSASTIKKCIKSLLSQAGCSFEVMVVDNASTDATVSILKEFKKIKLVQSKKNLGFGQGNNLGMKSAQGAIIVFVNPDTILPDDFGSKILKSFQLHSDAVIIGCRILNPNGSLQRTGNTFPTLRSLLYENSGYHKLFRRSHAYDNYIIKGWDRRSSRYIDAVSGACFGCRKEFLDKVGGFDNKYFLFFEEFDLAAAAHKLHQRVYFDSSIKVTHEGGVSTKQAKSDFIDKTYKASQTYYIHKHKGPIFYFSFKALALLCNVLAKLS